MPRSPLVRRPRPHRPSRVPATTGPARRLLVVRCTDWPVVALGRAPWERVAVVERGRVAAASLAAQAVGVALGERCRDALRHAQDLELTERDRQAEATVFWSVRSALVGELGPVATIRPGMAAVDPRGPARRLGGEEALRRWVERLVSGVVADWLARSGKVPAPQAQPCALAQAGVADGLLAAEVAAELQAVVPPGGSRVLLGCQPLEVLGHPEVAGALRVLGIRTLGDLARLAPSQVATRFGAEGLRAWRLASGEDVDPLPPFADAEPLVAEERLDPPEERLAAVAAVAAELAGTLTERLEAAGGVALAVRLELAAGGQRCVRRWTGPGLLERAATATRARRQLEAWASGRCPPTSGIDRVCLAVEEADRSGRLQGSLWGAPAHPADRASRAAERLVELLGPEGVAVAVSAGGRWPGERWRLVPLGSSWPGSSPSSAGLPWPGGLLPPEPALEHRPPLAVECLDDDGVEVVVAGDGLLRSSPAVLVVAGTAVPVVRALGPWIGDERWWEPPGRRAARLQVVTEGGAAHVLVRRQGQWWLEATYD
jgi:protein ImuB